MGEERREVTELRERAGVYVFVSVLVCVASLAKLLLSRSDGEGWIWPKWC